MPSYHHILVATDFSDESVEALQQAAALAKAAEARLSVVHVHDPKVIVLPAAPDKAHGVVERIVNAEDDAKTALRNLCEEKLGDVENVHRFLIKGPSAGPAIADWAAGHDVDLVVVGCHGRTGLTRLLLGSVAERVVRHSGCSVLVARP